MERPMVTFSTWKSWYLLFNVFIRYGLFLLVANALLWPYIGFCIDAFFCIFFFFPFILALTLFELILLFSIDHQGIKLTLNYLSGVFCLVFVSLQKSQIDWRVPNGTPQMRSGRRHSVRSLHRRLRHLVLRFQLSPTQQEGQGILTKLWKRNTRREKCPFRYANTQILTALL